MKIPPMKKLGIPALILMISIPGFYFYQQSQQNGAGGGEEFISEEGEPAFAAEQNEFENDGRSAKPTAGTAKPVVVKVDVKGAVKMPGVYTATAGERVIDLIAKAGNFSVNADKDKVNLAQLVEDQMVIYVPQVGEEIEAAALTTPQAGTGGPGATEGGAGEKVNLNTAEAADLETLPGIGPSKSSAILEYREKNGPFNKIEDMKNITGIGDKTFEKLKDSISVN